MDINERLDTIEKTLADLQGLLSKLLPTPEAKPEPVAVVATPEPVVEPPKPVEAKPTPAPRPPFKPEPMSPAKLEALNALKKQNQQKLQNQLNPPRPPAPPVAAPVVAQEPPANVFTTLTNLLNSKEWPHAVDPSLICDITSDQDKEDRAEGILDLIIDVHLENLKFLDFGCGEGHVINRCRIQKPKMAVGFDIKTSERWEKWEKTSNLMFTDNWTDVKNFGPYNIVLMYDVIDHMIMPDHELIAKLKELKGMLAVNGRIYLRAHPWASRHGTHLYHQINKAFAHMVFTKDELETLGYKQDEVRKVMTPLMTYERLFKSAGLKITNGPHQIKEGVEQFFINNPAIANRIKEHYKNSDREDLRNGTRFPSGPMEIQFIDYILM